MSEKKKVIFLSTGEYISDSRIYKQAHSLEEAGYDVMILAVWKKGLEPVEKEGGIHIERIYFPILKKLGFPFHKKKLLLPFYTLRAIERIRNYKPDIIQCERVHTIHIGLICKWLFGAKFIYDSRELAAYWPLMINSGDIARRMLIEYEKFVSKRAEFVIQTTESRAEHFYKDTKVKATVIMNKPLPAQNGKVIQPLAKAYHQDNKKVVAYVGAITTGRGIEHVAEAVSEFKDVKFFLLGPLKQKGEAIVKKYSEVIECLDPVDPALTTSVLKGVDVGISLTQNICLSYYYSCPTKLWELLVSGVPQLGSDFPEYRKIIRENEIGPVGRLCDPDNPEEIKRELHQMLNNPNELQEYRENALKLREQCVWETEGIKLVASYTKIFNSYLT
ncbi:glycosyltransferase, partial [candidate division KSB1 bacterium]|nr:glycosyltransferase [candidate division KSB1 bacterium]